MKVSAQRWSPPDPDYPDIDPDDYTTTYIAGSTGGVFGLVFVGVFVGCCVRSRRSEFGNFFFVKPWKCKKLTIKKMIVVFNHFFFVIFFGQKWRGLFSGSSSLAVVCDHGGVSFFLYIFFIIYIFELSSHYISTALFRSRDHLFRLLTH